MIYLTIIIPVRNEEKYIEDTLASLASQDYPSERFEIIVVDGMSTDATRNTVEQFIAENSNVNIILLENPGLLSSRARNIGVRAAQGTLIGIIDGHVYIPDDLLFKAMEELKERNRALCLARPAPLVIPEMKKGTSFWIAIARKSKIGHSVNSYIYSDYEGFVDPVSSGFAYDSKVFDQVGYFDESFDAAEDVEFHYRLKQSGIKAYTSPKLTIFSYPRKTFGSHFRQQVRYGEGRARFVRKHWGGFSLETPLPSMILLYCACAPLIVYYYKVFPLLGAAYIIVLSLYLTLLMVVGVMEAVARRKILPAAQVALAMWITHIGLGWGFLKTVFLPKTMLMSE